MSTWTQNCQRLLQLSAPDYLAWLFVKEKSPEY
jgi:hypothetical protein